MTSATTKSALWFTRTEAAQLVKLSSRQFTDAIVPRIAKQGKKGAGASLRYHGPTVVAALVDYRLSQRPTIPTDPLLAGGNSPALERYRVARARKEELSLQRELGTHCCYADLTTITTRAASVMRRHGEILQRRFGPEAVEIFNNGLEEAERILLSEFGNKPKPEEQDGSK